MSRSDVRHAIRAVTLLALGASSLAASACELGDGSCLRMSDCETGYACVEGTCRSDLAVDAPNRTPQQTDTGATDAGATGATVEDASVADAAAATDR